MAAIPSELDSSFGEGGEAVFQANPACQPACVEFGGSYAQALLLEANGKLVLGGPDVDLFSPGARAPSSLLRLQSNGALDQTFAEAGQAYSPPFTIQRLKKLANGDLLAAGSGPLGVGVERYMADGAPDDAFAPGGTRWLHPPPAPNEIAIDTAGRVLVMTERIPKVLEVMRFSASGLLDITFGFRGVVQLRYLPEAHPSSLTSAPDGGLVLAGEVPVQGTSESHLLLVRLSSSGKLDRAFGRHGFVITRASGYEKPVLALDRAGRLLVAAGEHVLGGRLLVWRYTRDGRLDVSFGEHGVASDTVFKGEGLGYRLGRVAPSAIAFDTADDPVIAGSHLITTIDTGSAGSWLLARYTQRGRDCSFGSAGLIEGNARGSASAVAVQPNGRIVIAGDRGHAFMAARYMGGGEPRTCPREGEAYLKPHLKRPRTGRRPRPH